MKAIDAEYFPVVLFIHPFENNYFLGILMLKF